MASLIALSDIVFGGPLVIVFLEADVVGCAPLMCVGLLRDVVVRRPCLRRSCATRSVFVLVRADGIGCIRAPGESMRSAMLSRAIGVSVKGEVGWWVVWRRGVDWVGNMGNERGRGGRFVRTAMVGAIGEG